MKSRSEELFDSIKIFYDDPKNSQCLYDILEKKKNISLRNLEWFITDYSKSTNFTYKTSKGKSFIVHCEYKSSLDGYSKKLFDPFCRDDPKKSTKFDYTIPGTETTVLTTVAQLNFIRWCIKNNIIEQYENLNSTKHKRDETV